MPEPATLPAPPFTPDYDGALAYEAPYLVEKLLKDSIVDSEEEARALFREVKRYLVLTTVDTSRSHEMASLLIDEVWHQFVLFTGAYMAYCRTFFGHYLPHAPANAPGLEAFEGPPDGTFEELGAAYERLFGEPLPDAWRDATSVRVDRRVHVNDRASLRVVDDGTGWVALAREDGVPLIDVGDLAKDALSFMTRTPAFYVRELPGALADEEKVGLVASLVDAGLLRLAS
jgi:hypothetical protein